MAYQGWSDVNRDFAIWSASPDSAGLSAIHPYQHKFAALVSNHPCLDRYLYNNRLNPVASSTEAWAARRPRRAGFPHPSGTTDGVIVLLSVTEAT
jgi:hypothetical protein